jgi:hypothetical protein
MSREPERVRACRPSTRAEEGQLGLGMMSQEHASDWPDADRLLGGRQQLGTLDAWEREQQQRVERLGWLHRAAMNRAQRGRRGFFQRFLLGQQCEFRWERDGWRWRLGPSLFCQGGGASWYGPYRSRQRAIRAAVLGVAAVQGRPVGKEVLHAAHSA